jgi:hypothetical protein
MALGNLIGRTGRGVAVAAAIVGVVGLTAAPKPAQAIGTGAAVGIGLGAFTLGTILANPYAYSAPYYPYGYGYYAPSYYYPPAPTYYPPRSCWSPYYRQYVAC